MRKCLKNERGHVMALMRAWRRDAATLGAGRQPSSGDEGGAMVEFALVAPILLLLLTGMFSVVMALTNYEQLGNATFAAAQQLITSRQMLSNGDPCATVESDITTALPSWTASKFTYTVTITDSSGTAHPYGPTAGSSFTCTPGYAELASNEPATVAVTYQYTWLPVWMLKLSGNLATSATVLVD